MYTQRDEEPFILNHFKNNIGKFLDIGAYDGKTFSTTRALYKKGWSGICIEPSPSVLPALNKLYSKDEKVQIIEAAITETTGLVDFYDSGGDMISSVDTEHVKKWTEKAGCTFTKLQIKSYSVDDLFKKIGYDFEFISLDVEGTNLDIISKFPFDKLTKTKMICVEFDFKDTEIMKLVKPFGFTLLHRTAENLLLVR